MEPIGNLVKKSMPTAASTTSPEKKHTELASSFTNTSKVLTPPGQSKKTGTALASGGLPETPLKSLEVALKGQRPTETLAVLKVSLPPGIQSSLKPEYNQAGDLLRYNLHGTHGASAIAQAREVVARSLTPITGNEALDLLTELKAMTRPAPGSTDDLRVVLKAYLRRIVEYPADVVRDVLLTQSEQSPWWPAWQELRDRLEIGTYRRRMMKAALEG